MSIARQSMDIEDLTIWALRDQGLGWVGKEQAPREDLSDLGTIIDENHTGSHPSISLWSDDDAMHVKMAIDQLPIEARLLVVQYGRAGLRPDWVEEGYGSIQQLRDSRGRLRWIWDDPVNRTGGKRPLLGFVGEQRENVDFHRAQYRLWWHALDDIVQPLNNVMLKHLATGPAVPREPWAESPVGVVYGDDGRVMEFAKPNAKVTEMSLEALRDKANAPVMTRATDWSVPKRKPRRRAMR